MELAAAILAGGRAERLGGVNKAALRMGATDIIDRQLSALRGLAADVFVVGPDRETWSARGLRVVPDEIPGKGAIGGIYTAIMRSPSERTLVLACDMPFVSAAFLRVLAHEIAADVVVPRTHRGYEPLCAIYSRACAPALRARLERGDLQASTPLEGVRVHEIGPEIVALYDAHGLLFTNVNTPHDYERARSLLDVNFASNHGSTEERITTDRSRT